MCAVVYILVCTCAWAVLYCTYIIYNMYVWYMYILTVHVHMWRSNVCIGVKGPSVDTVHTYVLYAYIMHINVLNVNMNICTNL